MTTQEKVQLHLEHLIEQGYNKDRILGIFLYGSQNYNLDTETSDVDTHAILLPSFEEMCLNKEWLSKEFRLENGEHIILKDIREYAKMLFKQNINFVETLFTEFKWVNPKYEQLFNSYFINNREEIARYNVQAAVRSVAHQGLNTLRQSREDGKKLCNVGRIVYCLEKYLLKENYEKCIKPVGKTHVTLSELKQNRVNEERKKELAEMFESFLNRVLETAEELPGATQTGAAAINNGVVAILKYSFSNPQTEITLHNFENKLTNTETRALQAIVDTIHTEGNITISKLVDETRISRPVYNNLLVKLKENNIAEVNNMGMKGTHIKFTHTLLKAKILEDKKIF